MYIDDKTFYKVFKEHPDWFTSWVDEGKQIWNRDTGVIIHENGLVMHDAVYRPPRDPNNYWKDCFNDQPKAIVGGENSYDITLACGDNISDHMSTLINSEEINTKATINL